ncbi:MAG: hypothetical protein CVV33_09365, partial [Methanomicrobiales archaeon HGW-Methanomicrobiales-4]
MIYENNGAPHKNRSIQMDPTITITGLQGLPLIQKGDDIAEMICKRISLKDGDVLCIATTIISKANGHSCRLEDITPGEQACHIASVTGEDPR